MSPLEAPEGTVWMYTPSPPDYDDDEIVFVVLGEAARGIVRRYVNLLTGDRGSFLLDSRMNNCAKRLA